MLRFVAVVFVVHCAISSAFIDDQNTVVAGTAEKMLLGATTAEIATFISDNPTYRMSTARVDTAFPLTLTVTFLPNSGLFAVNGYWWYYGVDVSQVNSFLSSNNARLIDLDSYNNGQLYVVVMISNTGERAHVWSWFAGISFADITTHSSNSRITRLNIYDDPSGTRRYNIILLDNTGAENTAWWWYSGVTDTVITSMLQTNNARLVSLQKTIDNTFHAVMVANDAPNNHSWWWYYAQTMKQTINLSNTINGRLISIGVDDASTDTYNFILLAN